MAVNKECQTFMEKLCEALDEDISSPICRELRDHLERCPDCSVQVDTIKRTVEIYRTLPTKCVPKEVEERLMLRLNLPSKGENN